MSQRPNPLDGHIHPFEARMRTGICRGVTLSDLVWIPDPNCDGNPCICCDAEHNPKATQ